MAHIPAAQRKAVAPPLDMIERDGEQEVVSVRAREFFYQGTSPVRYAWSWPELHS